MDRAYKDALWLRDKMRDVYKDFFDLTPGAAIDMKYTDAYDMSDAIYSERFEGIPKAVKYSFTDKQIYMVNNT